MASLVKHSAGGEPQRFFVPKNFKMPSNLLSKNMVVFDFETKGIKKRPEYPPKPVGCAIRWPGKKPVYYAWGHPTENNCSEKEGAAIVKSVFAGSAPVLMHNAKFDTDVAAEWLNLSISVLCKNIHDTLPLLFLFDPHAKSLSLKPSAERLLGIPPTERDDVREWLLNNGVITKAIYKSKEWAAFISEAPGDLVGKYAADGDATMTYKLWDFLAPKIYAHGMWDAYETEIGLIPRFIENEKQGVRGDKKGLVEYADRAQRDVASLENWLCKKLKVPKGFNFDSSDELADALTASKIVTQWGVTATGKRSTSKANMTRDRFKDQKVFTALAHRSRVQYGLSHFVFPWLEQVNFDGHIHTTWDSVRNPDVGGTRTGRVASSKPNIANVSKSLEDKNDGYAYDAFLEFTVGVLPLTLMRRYLLPDAGRLWLHRDYSQQELRVLAHYANGVLAQRLIEDPTLDVHELVKEIIYDLHGVLLSRRQTKDINFGIIYGLGVPGLSERLGLSVEDTKALRNAHAAALPDVAMFDKSTKQAGKRGEAVVTLGGRLYYAEEAVFNKKFGRVMDNSYKLVNYRVQGGSADITKRALLNYHDHPDRKGRFLVQVYDEINASAPKDKAGLKREAAVLRECMLEAGKQLGCSVPMLSDCKTGPSWGELKSYKG